MSYINHFPLTKKKVQLQPKPRMEYLHLEQEYCEDGVAAPTMNVGHVDAANDDAMSQFSKPVMVYGSDVKVITPQDIIDEVNALVSETMSHCSISSSVFLQIFRHALREMLLVNGNKKYNFLIAEWPILLQPGIEEYSLPASFDKDIALWVEKDCHYYTLKKKFTYVQTISWSQHSEDFIYTILRGKLLLKLPDSLKRMSCNHCGQCQSCTSIAGNKLRMEFYTLPVLPTKLTEPLHWFPTHEAARAYLVEILMEKVHAHNNRSYISEFKAQFRDAFLEYDQNLRPVDANRKHNRNHFIYSKY